MPTEPGAHMGLNYRPITFLTAATLPSNEAWKLGAW